MNTAIVICIIVTICNAFFTGYVIGKKSIGCKQAYSEPKTEEIPVQPKGKLELEQEAIKARNAEKSMHNFRNLINYNGKPQSPYDEVT